MNRIIRMGVMVFFGSVVGSVAYSNTLDLKVVNNSKDSQTIELFNEQGPCKGTGTDWLKVSKGETVALKCTGEKFTLMSTFNQKCNNISIPGGFQKVNIDKTGKCVLFKK